MFGNFGRPLKPMTWTFLLFQPWHLRFNERLCYKWVSSSTKLCEFELDTVALLFLFGNFGVQLMLNGWVPLRWPILSLSGIPFQTEPPGPKPWFFDTWRFSLFVGGSRIPLNITLLQTWHVPTVLGPARTPEEVKDMFLSFQAIKASFLEGTRGEDTGDQLQNGPCCGS